MILVITICASLEHCDRIAQLVDNCRNSGFAAQVLLAQTKLYDGHQKIKIECRPIR